MDRPFESDGEAPPPQDEANASVEGSSDGRDQQYNQQQYYSDHSQQHYNAQHNHTSQPEPESLTVFMRGLRDLAARHHKGGGGASQRMVVSRLHAAAIVLQVRSLFTVLQLQPPYAQSVYLSVLGGRARLVLLRSTC
jgi:hypothetical protein